MAKRFLVDVAIRGANLTEEGEFGRNVELAAMLDTTADWLSHEDTGRPKRLMDTNGNTVGQAWFEDDDSIMLRRLLGLPFMGPDYSMLSMLHACAAVTEVDSGGYARCARTEHEDPWHVRAHDGVIVYAWKEQPVEDDDDTEG